MSSNTATTPTAPSSSSSSSGSNQGASTNTAEIDATTPMLPKEELESSSNVSTAVAADDGNTQKKEDQLLTCSSHGKPNTFLPLIDETMINDGNSNLQLQQNGNGSTNIPANANVFADVPSPLGMSPTPLSDVNMNMTGCVVPPNTPALLSISIPRVHDFQDNQIQLDGDGSMNNQSANTPVGSDLVAAIAKKVDAHAASNLRHSAPSSSAVCANTNQKPPPSATVLSHRRSSVPTDARSSRIRLGICAMDKKARSKPMSEILSRLDSALFELVFFGDEVILNHSIDDWPQVDVLIAFYSSGYPLEKAEDYVAKYEPFVLNDLGSQHTLMDRRKVYDLMEENGIDVPRHVYVSRDGYKCRTSGAGTKEEELEEHDDFITVNGVTIEKPFVEKPVDADDHNIRIYYPQSAGGGSKLLFRKVGDRSSEFYPELNEIRREGSYIYEEFVETQGVDVKMYTVGPDYGHAEARKSPTVDGKVVRDSGGKEVRFPVILTHKEKVIARKIVLAFKQQVCGFDLLRVQEGDSLVSYCCDVNGWSFVKNSRKYYDDCAQILTETMLAATSPKKYIGFSALNPLLATIRSYYPDTPKRTKKHKKGKSRDRLLSMQRTSSTVSNTNNPSADAFTAATSFEQTDQNSSPVRLDEKILEKLNANNSNTGSSRDGTLSPKRESRSNSQVDGTISGYNSCDSSVTGTDGDMKTSASSFTGSANGHLEELRCVITVIRHGDRSPKQKLKAKITEPLVLDYFHRNTSSCRKDAKVKERVLMREFLEICKQLIEEKKDVVNPSPSEKELIHKLHVMRDVLERWTIGGLNRKLQLKPQSWETGEDGSERCTKILLILKWGGNLTKLGERQAVALGERLRHDMYPDTAGGGILRLHSTFRHDLKIKTSDEGRVMKTAASFAKGMLELEGDIPPILVSLVHKEKDSIHMLDPSGNKEVKQELNRCKERINEALQADFDVDSCPVEQREKCVGPRSLFSIHKALRSVGNPRKTLKLIHQTIGELIVQLEEMLGTFHSEEERNESGEGIVTTNDEEEALSGIKLYKGETLLELTERWRLLHLKLYDEDEDKFDLTRVPDVHDNVRFDMLHNPHLGLTPTLTKLYEAAKLMADIVVPQEYGVSIDEKKSIGSKMCRALLEKIKYDLIIARTDNEVDMRYMINMDYAADLPINTLGRRVRTRLYFTSESHLHTLLNVIRFPGQANDHLLSSRGREIISMSPELCYLTQVVIRLFENPKKDIDDPKRFRVEIQFSPGATATPSHMSELERDHDSSRFDTSPLQVISKDNLTAEEVEKYFTGCIKLGETDDKDEYGGIDSSRSNNAPEIGPVGEYCSRSSSDIELSLPLEKVELLPDGLSGNAAPTSENVLIEHTSSEKVPATIPEEPQILEAEKTLSAEKSTHSLVGMNFLEDTLDGRKNKVNASGSRGSAFDLFDAKEDETATRHEPNDNHNTNAPDKNSGEADLLEDNDEKLKRNSNNADSLAKGYVWKGIAAISLIFGFSCLALATSMKLNRRKW